MEIEKKYNSLIVSTEACMKPFRERRKRNLLLPQPHVGRGRGVRGISPALVFRVRHAVSHSKKLYFRESDYCVK